MEEYPRDIQVLNSQDQEVRLSLLGLLHSTENSQRKVWLVRNQEGSVSVLKGVSRESLKYQMNVEFLLEERKCLENIKHKRVVGLRGTFKDPDYLYLDMECIRGVTLTQLLISNQTLGIPYLALQSAQLVLLLQALHSQGIIYRDIKSSNLIVNPSGQLTLVDLGEAKHILVNGKPIRQNTFCGTPHMMAPEFHNGDYLKGYSFEVDYYALGALLYELAVGRAPFGYEKQNEHLLQDIQQGITQEALDEVQDHHLRSLVQELLRVSPQDRLQDMPTLQAHPFFAQHVDWEDIAAFMDIHLDNPTEDDKDLLDFFGHKYNLGFYGEDVEQIDHFTYGSMLGVSGSGVEGSEMEKLETFTL